MAGGHSRKKLDLTDQRFGKFTVLRPAENAGSLTAWVCRCDCGQETVETTKDLRRGRRTSCGCDGPAIPLSPGEQGRASLTYIDGTCLEMLAARTVRRNNTSGVPGVEWMRKKQRWRATICFKGKRRYLGSFDIFDDAVKARKRAEEELFDKFVDVYSGKLPKSELRDIDDVCLPIVRDYGARRRDLVDQRFDQLTVLAP